MISAVILTVSDSCFEGRREDISGPAVVRVLKAHGLDASVPVLVPDECPAIEDALRKAASKANFKAVQPLLDHALDLLAGKTEHQHAGDAR